MINWIKKKIKWILISVGILGVALASTLVPVEQTEPIGATATSTPQTIVEMLEGKTTTEKANIKGLEIAKIDFRGEYTSQEYGIRIDIQSIKAIEGGVEIMARAWRGTKQLGFGKDGSVEIERFRWINPPVLVDDPNGEITRVINDPVTGEFVRNRKLREDPAQAIKQDLAHTITIVGKEDTDIIVGKVGNTTTTFRSVAGANSPVDGYTDRNSSTWAATRTGDANAGTPVTGTTGLITAEQENPSAWGARHFYSTFDTSSIGTDNVDSVVLSYASQGSTPLNPDSTTAHILGATLIATNNLANGDHDAYGATSFGSKLTSNWDATDGNFNDFTLNASGEANINKTGVSEFAMLFDLNRNDSPEPSANNNIIFYAADDGGAGTTNDPTLIVVHSVPVSAEIIRQDIIWFD